MSKEEILSVKNLHVNFHTYAGDVKAIRNVNFELYKGETLAIVGESGSGKSVTTRTLMGLSAKNAEVKGDIQFKGRSLNDLVEKDWVDVRGNEIAMIFQDPMTSLDPTMKIWKQITEPILIHDEEMEFDQAFEIAVDLMEKVGIPNAREHANDYPHQWSGGMRQRAVIAIALAANPEILIADEPTTALDVTIQAQILELMQDLQKKLGMAIIMVTHDLGVIASMCDEIIVMYGGRVCERGTADDIFYNPRHEYTKGLLRSIPKASNMNEKLVPIAGSPINLLNLPKGCAFCSRCENAMKICLTQKPEELPVDDRHYAACWLNVKKMMEEEAR